MDSLTEVFQHVLSRLESESIPYMIVGSVASIIYGEPRMTKDMDLVIEVPANTASKLTELFSSDDFYCPPAEVLRSEVQQQGQFNVLHPQTGLKIDFIIRKSTPHAREEFARRRIVPVWKDFKACVASPEDVIIKKLVYYREGESDKHLQDIRGILANTDVDREYMDRWITALGLEEPWSRIE